MGTRKHSTPRWTLRARLLLPMVVGVFLFGPACALAATVTVSATGAGSGQVTGKLDSSGATVISCTYNGLATSGTCSAEVGVGLAGKLDFTGVESLGSAFAGWAQAGTLLPGSISKCEGLGSGSEHACSIETATAATVTASFGLALLTPEVSISGVQPGEVSDTSATFHGTVNPRGSEVSACRFEVVKQSDPAGFASAAKQQVSCVPGPAGIGDGSNPEAVAATDPGLEPNTVYRVRLLATKAGAAPGEATAEASPFATSRVATVVTTGTAFSESDTTATLHASVNPMNNVITECNFEYGIEESYGSSAPCSPLKVGVNEVQSLTVSATAGQFKLTFGGQTTEGIPFNASAEAVQSELRLLSSIGSPNVTVSGGPGNAAGSTPYIVTFTGSLGAQQVAQLSVTSGSVPLSGGTGASVATTTTGTTGLAAVQVSAEIEGLAPQTTYHYRVVTSYAAGETSAGSDETFTTAPSPAAITGGASDVSQNAATITATLDTQGLQTSYGFEIGTSTDYGPPTGLGFIGAGAGDTPVALNLTGLQPGTTYHYRVLATSAEGTSYGADQTFTTSTYPNAFVTPPAPLPFVSVPAIAFPVGETGAVTKAATKTLTKAQKLKAALKVCKKRAKGARAKCEKRARKQYAPAKTKKKR